MTTILLLSFRWTKIRPLLKTPQKLLIALLCALLLAHFFAHFFAASFFVEHLPSCAKPPAHLHLCLTSDLRAIFLLRKASSLIAIYASDRHSSLPPIISASPSSFLFYSFLLVQELDQEG
ncbi:unnamed protein product [Cuscuta europaea]|uniref:Uncharacterized protein n=1 Tax=Cuscuta europaea TaxID=41803 RepID=A0A9P0ZTT8_CUSEU|nr:unnamed protein product [Cuscuta europaea]